MNKKDDQIIESLIAGGFIGAVLGALLTKKSKSGGLLGAIAGAALLATFKANEKARNLDFPILIKENNIIYEHRSDGTKHIVKIIEKSTKKVPEYFKLK